MLTDHDIGIVRREVAADRQSRAACRTSRERQRDDERGRPGEEATRDATQARAMAVHNTAGSVMVRVPASIDADSLGCSATRS